MEWMLVTVTPNGKKFGGKLRFGSYKSACMMQEIMEVQRPDDAFLVYTVEEWEQEVRDGVAM